MLKPKPIIKAAGGTSKAVPKIIQGGARSPVGGNVAFDPRLGRSGGFRYINGPNRGRVAPMGSLNAMAAPPSSPRLMAGHGKKVAAGLVVGGATFGMLANKTGKAVDPSSGLPKGIYNY